MRLDKAPETFAVLQDVLSTEVPKLPASTFHERIASRINQLRDGGWEMVQSASAYIAHWLTQGYLERHFPQGANEEVYELSSACLQAMRFIDGLEDSHRVATESRLNLVIDQLVKLCAQTDPNPASRIESLVKERNKLDAEIKQIRKTGRAVTLSNAQAMEQIREILVLTKELINDFRQVKDSFQGLNRQLREQIIESNNSRGEVLEKLFNGVDVIASSEAGRSFTAFWRLLINFEQSAKLEESTEQLLAKDFANGLSGQERLFLLTLTKNLLAQGGTVHEVLQYFARSLKRFVKSRAYQEQRRMLTLLRETEQYALRVKNFIPYTETMFERFYSTSSKIKSVSELLLHDLSLATSNVRMGVAEAAALSMAEICEWIAKSEINYSALKKNIIHLLDQYSQVSIADILTHFPAAQGLASVVGYIALGVRHGEVTTHCEQVSWEGGDGVLRSASIPKIYFLTGCKNEFGK